MGGQPKKFSAHRCLGRIQLTHTSNIYICNHDSPFIFVFALCVGRKSDKISQSSGSRCGKNKKFRDFNLAAKKNQKYMMGKMRSVRAANVECS